MVYTGKIEKRLLSASSQIVVLFANGQMLEFDDIDGAKRFLDFYNRNSSARSVNPGKIYLFMGGEWQVD